jgi:multiple sugar transport system ATP-binding protein
MPRSEIARRVDEAARILRIAELLDKPVSGLSSGDRQRVALGRAIVREPKAFMMDEPLGALDAEFRELMCGELRALHDRIHATTVYVTHDQQEAMAMADTIAVMNKGVIEQMGPPQQIYDRPASLFVAEFIGSPAMGLLPLEGGAARGAETVRFRGQEIGVPRLHEDADEERLWLGVRPEHVRIGEHGELPAEVFGVEYLGTTQIVTLAVAGGTRLRARIASSIPVAPGAAVRLSLQREKLSLFRGSDGRAVRSALHEPDAPAPGRPVREAAHG